MFTQWQQHLSEIRFGKIWWYNFQYDFQKRDLPKDLEELFCKAIEQQLEASNDATPPLAILNEVLESPSQSFSLKGPQVNKSERLSCVVPSYAFATWLIDRDLIGLGTSEVLEGKVWELFERGEITPEIHYNEEAELKSSRRNFFWATLTNSLDKVFSGYRLSLKEKEVETEPGMFATDVRNLLGLSYLGEGVGLYRIDLPNLPAGIRVYIPTTLDSSPSCVFLPAESNADFGKTFSLNEKDIGVEEVVISPMAFSKDCQVTQIGFVSAPLPDDDSVWCALEQCVINRRS